MIDIEKALWLQSAFSSAKGLSQSKTIRILTTKIVAHPNKIGSNKHLNL